jgi:hypothetical protein
VNDPRSLELARRELQRLGYLKHRVERFLLSDAVSAAGEPRAFLLVSIKVGLLAGTLLALANVLVLGAANDLFRTAPADLLPLYAHLWPPLVLSCALGFVAAAGGFLFALRLFPRRSLEVLILGVAFVATGVLFGWALFRARDFLLDLGRGPRVVAAIVLPLLAAGIAKLLANGLLSLAIRLTRLTPRERLVSRRTILAVLGGALGLLTAVALAWPEAKRPSPPPSLPVAPGESVAFVGLDGILPGELDYLLARGALPELARRVAGGGVVLRYARPEGVEPAELWTTFATGVDAGRHGVGAIDGYRPAGLDSTLSRSGPWTLWFRFVARPLRLAEHRPILAGRRRAFAFWELAAHGGAPVAAVNWWATYPAAPIPGLVVAHGAFQLLSGHADGAVSPAHRAAELAALAAATPAGAFGETLAAALPAEPAREALEKAMRPDRFYREVASRERSVRALAVYLPGIDLVAEGWLGGDVAFADLVRTQLVETDALLGSLAEGGAVVLVADPGRRGGTEGRAILLRSGCRPDPAEPGVSAIPETPEIPEIPEVTPAEIAASVLRALGLPQSAELPQPLRQCRWPEPPTVVDGFGEPSRRSDPAEGSGDYLENLRSLGYL